MPRYLTDADHAEIRIRNAAPELLAALSKIAGYFDPDKNAYIGAADLETARVIARAAIAKAKGE